MASPFDAVQQTWEAFAPEVQVILYQLHTAVIYRGGVEKVQEWWARNQESLDALGITVDTQVDQFGSTALTYASRWGHEENVRYLVGVCGADVNFKELLNGRTPLRAAASANQPACVRALLELGADPNLQDYEGQTALGCAREYEWQDCIDILEQWVPIPTVKSALKG